MLEKPRLTEDTIEAFNALYSLMGWAQMTSLNNSQG